MLIVGVLVMYHTKAFWGLESNSNACTLNTTMNVATSYTLYMPIVLVVVAVIMIALVMSTSRGFG